MPTMSSYRREELAFFLSPFSRVKYHAKCLRCTRSCKQSFKILAITCPIYSDKRKSTSPKPSPLVKGAVSKGQAL